MFNMRKGILVNVIIPSSDFQRSFHPGGLDTTRSVDVQLSVMKHRTVRSWEWKLKLIMDIFQIIQSIQSWWARRWIIIITRTHTRPPRTIIIFQTRAVSSRGAVHRRRKHSWAKMIYRSHRRHSQHRLRSTIRAPRWTRRIPMKVERLRPSRRPQHAISVEGKRRKMIMMMRTRESGESQRSRNHHRIRSLWRSEDWQRMRESGGEWVD